MLLTKWIFLVFGVSIVLMLTLILLDSSGQIKLGESLDFIDKLMMFLFGLVNLVMGYWFGAKGKQEEVDTAVRTTITAMKES